MATKTAARTAEKTAAAVPAVATPAALKKPPAKAAAKTVANGAAKTPRAVPPAKAAPPARTARKVGKVNAKAGRAARPTAPAGATDTPAAAPSAEASNTVRLSAQQVWQAGLAAFAKAQEEGGRVFSKLVQEGHALQQRKQQGQQDKAAVADTDAAPGGPGPLGAFAEDLGKQAAGSWDKLEHVFEERVARALAKIGVPAQQELEALALRVDELSRELALLKAAPPATRPARKKAPAASGS